MSKCLLITRPDHDITTNYLFYWSGEIISIAERHNVKIVDLKGKRANRKELVSIIKKIDPDFILFNGHGNDKVIYGYDNEALIEAGINERILSNKLTYAVSCSSAKILGPSAIRYGVVTFIGYDADFVFLIDENCITRPLLDQTAKLFLEPSNEIAKSLIKGHTTEESYHRSQKAFRKNIQKLLTSESVVEEKEALPYLLWDMRHQVCLGDRDATL